ncbi:MAG: MFS transporter [Burkholderiales bacterium]|jgi:predicted MFS family arabinose efflux permease|nr:MFS transporter [Burkholderiales bacterium]
MSSSRTQTLTPGIVRLMAAGAGLCVASNYFAQPLLALFAQTFGVSSVHAGLLVTMAQLGYVAGLILVVPLGDLLERRRLLVTTTALTAAALLAMGLAPNFEAMLLVSVVIGVTSVAAQVLVPLSAHLAPPAQRGRIMSTVMSGLLLGILLARFAAGMVAGLAGWRAVYLIGAVLMLALCLSLRARLPEVAPTAGGSYGALLRSIGRIFAAQPVLRRRGVIGGLCFAAFGAFWTAAAFMLKANHGASELVIGGVALVGVLGALCARFAGRLADAGWGPAATGGFVLLSVLSWLPLWWGQFSWPLFLAGVVLLDMGVQGAHISNQTEVYRLDPAARSRITTVYMSMYFTGGAIGSLLSGLAYARFGWHGVAAVGAAMAMAAFVYWAAVEGGHAMRRRTSGA